MVDNGRNDCVDSMVNDVENPPPAHRKTLRTLMRAALEASVVIDMCAVVLMKLTMIVT